MGSGSGDRDVRCERLDGRIEVINQEEERRSILYVESSEYIVKGVVRIQDTPIFPCPLFFPLGMNGAHVRLYEVYKAV